MIFVICTHPSSCMRNRNSESCVKNAVDTRQHPKDWADGNDYINSTGLCKHSLGRTNERSPIMSVQIMHIYRYVRSKLRTQKKCFVLSSLSLVFSCSTALGLLLIGRKSHAYSLITRTCSPPSTTVQQLYSGSANFDSNLYLLV